ncbi:MAG TPA: RNA methyltransferase [Candidatus Omnitrophota bacterium]|nr:RNA methyltransferase [Candidatus Omnitrophota bacterium]
MRKLTHQEILERQKEKLRHARLPFAVVLNNVRSLYNVGSIFRTSDGAGVEKIWICGITGHPPNSRIAKTALDAQEHVPWEYREDIFSLLKELKKKKYQIVLLEQTQESRPYEDFKPEGPVCLVVGNEIDGVTQEIIPYCDKAIEIEMAGIKNSLNVAVAFGIIAYHFRYCFNQKKK